jgi:MraZ protein
VEDLAPSQPKLDLPKGMYSARLDDRGRMKLPADFQTALETLREKKLFVTSMDRHIGQIFPMEEWRKQESFLESFTDDPKIARKMLFNASDLGGEATVDTQGRIVFPTDLRRELGIENAQVRIYGYKGRIEILSEEIYEARRREAAEVTSDDVTNVEAKRPRL